MSLFTAAELRLLKLSDKVEDQGEHPTDSAKNKEYCRAASDRLRARMGEDAYLAMNREREARKRARKKAKPRA